MGESNTQVVTLGHGMTEGILKHEYLGGEKVKEDVARGFNSDTGRCEIRGYSRSEEPPYLINGVVLK